MVAVSARLPATVLRDKVIKEIYIMRVIGVFWGLNGVLILKTLIKKFHFSGVSHRFCIRPTSPRQRWFQIAGKLWPHPLEHEESNGGGFGPNPSHSPEKICDQYLKI